MSKLVRWSPVREMMNLRDEFDRLFEESFTMSPRRRWPQVRRWGLALDLVENEDEFVVTASIPGVDPDDVEITLTDNVLTIKGEKRDSKDIDEGDYHLRERRYGTFSRSITLPIKVKESDIEAISENGVLTVTVPKAEEVKSKRIAIKINKGRKTIEG